MPDPPRKSLALDLELVLDLGEHLELVLRGGIPNPERAAELLRRLNNAIRHSRQSKP
jgi:hypothetical protein